MGPSAAASRPSRPAWKVYSRFSELPLRSFKSNTPDRALPYSAAKAPVIKSELDNNCALRIEMPPPEVPTAEKWLGLGISTPSMRQSRPLGALPRMAMVLLPSLAVATPANAEAIRPGSFTAAAKRRVSSTENVRALTVANSFSGFCLSILARTTTSRVVIRSSSSSMVSSTSLPESRVMFGTMASL